MMRLEAKSSPKILDFKGNYTERLVKVTAVIKLITSDSNTVFSLAVLKTCHLVEFIQT